MATNQITTNKNALAISDGFRMVFHRAPNVSYFCQNFIMPSVTGTEATINRPKLDVYIPGDKIVFDALNITMLVAENMENYVEVLEWMMRDDNVTDDITLYILSSKNNVNRTVTFKNAFPTSIGSISFNVQDADITYAQVDVTFRYDYFTFSDARGENTIGP
jgi:hypothetical protein